MALRNPIIPGHNPDPTIIRDGEDYFLVTSTFEYFPGLPIYQSRDLANWNLIGHALDRPSQLHMRTVETGGGIFAPSLRRWKGRFYIACTAMYRVPNMENFTNGMVPPRGFYVWTDDIRGGNWSDPVYFDTVGIDQDLFFDDDDRIYLSLATILPTSIVPQGFAIGVYVMEIDLQSGKAISAPTLIRHSPHGASVAEGPHIFKKDGFYYVSIAEGGTEKDHQQWIFRSSTGPLGPYEDPPAGVNPILHNGDSEQIQQTGHMDMVESPSGQWWAVYLAVRGGRYEKGGWSQLGRETFLSPVEWVDGWPKVNSGERVEINGSKGASLLRIEESMIERYTFEPATRLPAGWYHLRTPMTKDWSLDDRPGSLTLYGTPYTLDIDECPAAVFRKQTAFSGTWTFNLDFGAQEGDEAGVVVWWSRRAYASLSIIGQAGGSAHLQVKWCEADSDVFSTSIYPLSTVEEISLQVEATPSEYIFSATSEQGTWRRIQAVPAQCIVRNRPSDSRNVGTHFGLFAQGTAGWPCRNAAYFRDVVWTGTREGGP